MSTVLVTDFDGTITKVDFFHKVVNELLAPEDIKPWNEYEQGLITHFDALNLIFQKVRLAPEELHRFILDLPVEECFIETVRHCRENDIPIYIVSAGADYYIKYILSDLGVEDSVNLIANKSAYNGSNGLEMYRLEEESPFYSHNYGVDKEKVAKFLKNKYDRVVFAGDGTPDLFAAQHADVVLARGALKKLCEKNGINAIELDSYCTVLEQLKC